MDSTPSIPARSTPPISTRIQIQVDALTTELLRQRSEEGCWRGHLASSAFATALSLAALSEASDRRSDTQRNPVERAFEWLARYRNADGGWGDTPAHTSSARNTLAVYLALSSRDSIPTASSRLCEEAADWLNRASNTARLGTGFRSWTELVLQESRANESASTFPITSLISLVQWADRSTNSNRLANAFQIERWISAAANSKDPWSSAFGSTFPRSSLWGRLFRSELANRKTIDMQLPNGSLQDSPALTSAALLTPNPRGVDAIEWRAKAGDFLVRSQRPDGSWPLDLNFSTRCTARAIEGIPANVMGPINRERTRDWLRRQQFRVRHPLSNSPPGGWSWTSTPSGIPNVEDTAQVLLTLKKLGPTDAPTLQSATDGCEWLLTSQTQHLRPSILAQRALLAWSAELSAPLQESISEIFASQSEFATNAIPPLPEHASLLESARWLVSIQNAQGAARSRGHPLPAPPQDWSRALETVLQAVEQGEWKSARLATFHACGLWTCEEKDALLLILSALSHALEN